MAGTDPSLENIEPSFQQDLNGDGTNGVPAAVTYSGSVTYMFFFAIEPQATIVLSPSPNTASASAGLSAPSLTFIGTPDIVTHASGTEVVNYALQPSSGIVTIANFVLGSDQLNIDLAGAPNSILQAFDTSVGGNHAIAIASSADLTHGIVLLNQPLIQTAADLLASHTVFNNGFAHIA